MLTIATGNKAVAAAVKEARPSVIAAYPITPQTEIVEQMAEVRGWGGKFVVPIPEVRVLD